jgi:hypothetical protein
MTTWKPGMSFTIDGFTDNPMFSGIIIKVHDQSVDVIFTDGAIFQDLPLSIFQLRKAK